MSVAAKQHESSGQKTTPAECSKFEHPSLANQLWYALIKSVLQLFLVLLYRIRSWGVENVPTEGPMLLAPNHQSHLDPPLVGCCCPRQMSYLARSTLFKFAPFAWYIRSLGAFPINQSTGKGFGGIKETLRRLKRGDAITVFPEGSRTPDGLIHPFQPGIRTLAVRSGATIVPVAIEGAYAAWPRWRGFPRLGTIHVRFGKPLSPDEIAKLGEDALLEEVERRVRHCYAEVCSHPAIAQARRKAGIR